jgi:hypothetical protein
MEDETHRRLVWIRLFEKASNAGFVFCGCNEDGQWWRVGERHRLQLKALAALSRYATDKPLPIGKVESDAMAVGSICLLAAPFRCRTRVILP